MQQEFEMDQLDNDNIAVGKSAIGRRVELPWWQKYTLTLNEASEYFGISVLQ